MEFRHIYLAPQNDRQNLSFVIDKHTYGKKMAITGRTKVIYKGTFIPKQTLLRCDRKKADVQGFSD